MYLVHIHLRPPLTGDALPCAAEDLLAASAVDIDCFELAVAHPYAHPLPVIGVYLHSRNVEAAEDDAGAIWRKATTDHPQLRPWVLVRAEVPLLMPDFD